MIAFFVDCEQILHNKIPISPILTASRDASRGMLGDLGGLVGTLGKILGN